jgi:hypothetical protein
MISLSPSHPQRADRERALTAGVHDVAMLAVQHHTGQEYRDRAN